MKLYPVSINGSKDTIMINPERIAAIKNLGDNKYEVFLDGYPDGIIINIADFSKLFKRASPTQHFFTLCE